MAPENSCLMTSELQLTLANAERDCCDHEAGSPHLAAWSEGYHEQTVTSEHIPPPVMYHTSSSSHTPVKSGFCKEWGAATDLTAGD